MSVVPLYFFGAYLAVGTLAVVVLGIFHLFNKKIRKTDIAVIEVYGIILDDKRKSGKLANFLKEVKRVRALEAKAVLLKINSPGGTIVASEQMYRALMNLRKEGVKIVALMEEVAASGGYYIAMAADNVVASEGTITGSIGVLLQNFNIASLLGKLGIKAEVIKSGKFKDSLSRTREIGEEDREVLRAVVLDMHEQFCKVVANSRNIPLEEVRKLESRVLTGKQAKELKLIDELGGYEEAVQYAKDIAGITQEKVRIADVSRTLFGFSKLKLKPAVLFGEMRFRMNHIGMPLWFFDRF